jgi:hypothetical protein
MPVDEELGLGVEDVVVEGVLEVVPLVAGLVVLGGTEVLPDDDDDDEVVTELVERGDEVVGGTGVGDVGVVLVGEEEEGDSEITPTDEVVKTTGGGTDGMGVEAMVVLKG